MSVLRPSADNVFRPFEVSLAACLFVFGETAPSGPLAPHSWTTSITHNDATHSVGLPWLVAKTSTWQQTTLKTNIHTPGGIRTHNLSRRAAADLRLRQGVHWDRQVLLLALFIYGLISDAI